MAARAFGVCATAPGLRLDLACDDVAVGVAGAVVTVVDAGCEEDASPDFFGVVFLVGELVPLGPVSPASGSTY